MSVTQSFADSPRSSPPIRVVLIDTSHPGNIGAAARAMKNMGLTDLVLVRPKEFPSEEATARAAGAVDVLERARVVQTLQEGVADCGIVAGATARDREHYQTVYAAREAAREATALQSQGQAVAFVFGSERFGLSNEELACCNWLLRIPTHPVYPSLNLAQAVQIVCYELLMATSPGATVPAPERESPLATATELEHLYGHLERVMEEVEFRDRTPSGGNLMPRLRRLFNRASMDRNEINILRGILRAVQTKRGGGT